MKKNKIIILILTSITLFACFIPTFDYNLQEMDWYDILGPYVGQNYATESYINSTLPGNEISYSESVFKYATICKLPLIVTVIGFIGIFISIVVSFRKNEKIWSVLTIFASAVNVVGLVLIIVNYVDRVVTNDYFTVNATPFIAYAVVVLSLVNFIYSFKLVKVGTNLIDENVKKEINE